MLAVLDHIWNLFAEEHERRLGDPDLAPTRRFGVFLDQQQAFLENQLEQYRNDVPLIAIGMDMQEGGYPASRHIEAYRLAKELGYYTTAHTGETGATDIWSALELPLDRIDHGGLCVEDDKLVQAILDRGLPMTVWAHCPIS